MKTTALLSRLMKRMPKPPAAKTSGLDGFSLSPKRKLILWLSLNRPDLREELASMTEDEARVRLNAETGLNVQEGDECDLAWGLYLDALEAKAQTTH